MQSSNSGLFFSTLNSNSQTYHNNNSNHNNNPNNNNYNIFDFENEDGLFRSSSFQNTKNIIPYETKESYQGIDEDVDVDKKVNVVDVVNECLEFVDKKLKCYIHKDLKKAIEMFEMFKNVNTSQNNQLHIIENVIFENSNSKVTVISKKKLTTLFRNLNFDQSYKYMLFKLVDTFYLLDIKRELRLIVWNETESEVDFEFFSGYCGYRELDDLIRSTNNSCFVPSSSYSSSSNIFYTSTENQTQIKTVKIPVHDKKNKILFEVNFEYYDFDVLELVSFFKNKHPYLKGRLVQTVDVNKTNNYHFQLDN